MARGRGGKRTPRNPAATSGPGALSARTDGGPAGKPLIPPGQPYGQRQRLEAVAANTPSPREMAATQAPPQPSPGTPAAPPMTPPVGDPFGPSMRPTEPGDAGLVNAPGDEPLPATLILQELHRLYPSPWLARLLGVTDAVR